MGEASLTTARAAIGGLPLPPVFATAEEERRYRKRRLAGAFIDLLVCECVSLGAARALHAAPGQMSVWSAVAKYFVPVRVEALVRELAVVLGARHYIREGHFFGHFQKLMRDNAVAGLFDGSTVINLNAISQQRGQLYEYRAGSGARLADESRELGRLAPARRGHGNAFGQPAESFEVSRRYCTVAAAAACLRMWLHNHAWASEFFADGEWLALALHRLLPSSGPCALGLPPNGAERCMGELLRLYRENWLFSVVPFQLAGPGEITGYRYR
jgi:hypothetical protein